jgi:hypothetical protein
MSSSNQHQPTLRKLDRFELREASMWVAEKWFEQFVRSADGAESSAEFAEFGAFEPNLAEAIVLDHGSDFVFPKWGAALNTLCGGDHRGHRLSVLPQPSRGQLCRLCVRATVAQAPAADHATWVVDGQIWQCAMLAMPTASDELSVRRLLVAVLFAPHPIFATQVVPDDESHVVRLDQLLPRRERLADRAEREPHFSCCRGQIAGSDNADERVELGHAIQHARSRAYRLMEGITNLRRKIFQRKKGRLQDTERSEAKHTSLMDVLSVRLAHPGKN